MRSESDAGVEQGVHQLSAILPNGRTVWLRVATPLAPAASLEGLARQVERASDDSRTSIAAHARDIDRLAARVRADSGRLQQAWTTRQRRSLRGLISANHALERRFEKAREELRSRFEKQFEIDRENLRRLRRRGLWDKILLASSLPLFAAYGDRESPFGSNNLALTFLMLVWLVGDQVVEALFGSDRSKSRYALADADIWSYIAPVANGLAAWWLLGDRQHERFITGITTVSLDKKDPPVPAEPLERFHVSVDLSGRVANDHFGDFETFTGVPAVATLGGRRAAGSAAIAPDIQGLRATVRAGTLRLKFRAVRQPAEVEIAWMVDTSKPAARGD